MCTLDANLQTCLEQWMTGMDGERESREPVLAAWLDNDDEMIKNIQIMLLMFTKFNQVWHKAAIQ